jgi:TonB-linked SusC/RagA family outer membrane protein
MLTGVITPCFSRGQDEVKITLRVENASLEEILKTIEERSGYRLLYNLELVQGVRGISLSGEEQPVSRLLDKCLKGTGLGYAFSENTLVISRQEPRQTRQQPRYRVHGTVVDKEGVPLIGVSVLAGESAVGAATDAEGRFAFFSPDSTGNLIVSYIGYATTRVPYASGEPLVIVLEENVSTLDAVTVVAYGTRKTRDIVGAISSVKADELRDIPSSGFENLLQGRMSGVEIVNQSGAPGGGGTLVVIRGYNTFKKSLVDDPQPDGAPLYVIDGVPMHSFTSTETGLNTIADIDPSIIESIEVLKDAASASIYGSRSGNGVILITTKKGKRGKPAFSASLSYSRSILPAAPRHYGGQMERKYYLEALRNYRTAGWFSGKYPASYDESAGFFDGAYDFFWNQGIASSTTTLRVLQDSLNPFYNNATDWFKAVFRAGKILNANLQASGGNETLRYMLSGNYYKEAGIMIGSDFNRVGANLGLYLTPNERFSLNARVYAAYTDRSRGNSGKGGNYKVEGLTVDPRSTSSLLLNSGVAIEKLLERLNTQVEENTGYRFTSNGGLEFEFIDGLRAKVNGGIDFVQVNRHFFRPSALDPYTSRDELENRIENSIQRVIFAQGEGLLTYKRSFDDRHNLDALLGISLDRSLELMSKIDAEGTPSDYIQQVVGIDPIRESYGWSESRFFASTNKTEKVNESFFGRVAYNYEQRYLVEATLRRDGSSVFGEDKRWATFPSVAAGWAFSDEPFAEALPWLAFGKARVSWGQSGVQFAEPYLAHGLMAIGQSYNGVKGMTSPEILNRELGWEESDQLDVGLDLDLFDYRLRVKADYYYRYTRGKLWKIPVPSSGSYYGPGMSGQYQNTMDVSNQGVEVELTHDFYRDTPLTWRSKLTLSRNWNRFEKSYSGFDVAQYVIGKPLFQIMMYKGGGYYQSQEEVPAYYQPDGSKQYLRPMSGDQHFFTAGDARISDLDGDGVIDINDMVYVGSSLAKVYGGWMHELKWKNLELDMLFSYAIGRDMYETYSYSSLDAYTNGQSGNALYVNTSAASFWTPETPNATHARLGTLNSGTGMIETNLERVSYVKLKTMTLGYSLREEWTRKAGVAGIRLFVTGENLFTLTNYSGVDPEAVSVEDGHDTFDTYPLARKWTVGLTLNF